MTRERGQRLLSHRQQCDLGICWLTVGGCQGRPLAVERFG